MSSRNFGLGTRDLAKAGRFALVKERIAGGLSFESVAVHSDRWNLFATFAKGQGVRRMEHVTPELVIGFGKTLADQVSERDISAAYAQNIISSANAVMNLATRGAWQSVSPTRDCGIPHRAHVRRTAPDLERGRIERAPISEHGKAIAGLAREFGLRSREASLLDGQLALEQAKARCAISIQYGTKGGRPRNMAVRNERQLRALERAAGQQDGRSMIPSTQTWKGFREGELREIREAVGGLHELRAAYACEHYRELTGVDAPCIAGRRQCDRGVDLKARQVLAEELGHGRTDVLSSYIGSLK